MSLTFVNIKSGERRVCHTEPMIAAHLNTSDRNPNAMQGQDMGWRLSPETVLELERIAADPVTLQTIATTFGILLESVSESDILVYISAQNNKEKTGATVATSEYQRQYEDDIRRLRERDAKIEAEAQAKGERPTSVKPLVTEDNDDEPTGNDGSGDGSIETGVDGLKRPELEAKAAELGIENPDKFKNRDELIKAINDKSKES